ncbi:hypothetical protein N780_20005 [Pontibacillus chungwhensis BH030062]|uniref:PD-(D/E)XK nuclease superfamily protein n=1 Tax=Pontibacillus chungwhensis BH030062 TaxID=1385513 RepID=A0A0A2VCY0_9BACI|nr:PD-(D/E)XK nuclease family protein [Pontibacillus chungwhensis]KGP91520.1 hypothetical protein N780_20005 [Pontibacillus chungwhensis BH030062]
MSGVFKKLLALYSPKDGQKVPYEDFTTEILVGILAQEQGVLDDFVNNVLGIEGGGFSVQSQRRYMLEDDIDCIVDVVFLNNDTICFLENKINASEGDRQLERYKKVLSSFSSKHTYLRYCTKNYDPKEVLDINFHQFLWRDIYRFLKSYEANELIKEFLEYLRGLGMGSSADFNLQDLMTMKQMMTTMAKMDECLDSVTPIFERYFGEPYTYDQARLKEIPRNRYSIWKGDAIPGGRHNESKIIVGFEFEEVEERSPTIFVGFMCSHKHPSSEGVRSNVEAEKFDYTYEDESSWYWYEKYLADFISAEDQFEEISKWFVQYIDKVNEELEKVLYSLNVTGNSSVLPP